MSDFKFNYRGAGEILTSESMRLMLVAKAEKVKAFAEALSADIQGPSHPTHYAESFRVTSTTHGGIHHDRAEARVVNDDAQALAMEFGVPAYPNYPKRRILGRALDSLR